MLSYQHQRKMLHKLLIFFVLTTSFVLAERSGPYLGIGYGYGMYEPGNRITKVEEQPYNIRLTAGAYINENLSVELGFAEFGGAVLGYDLSNYRTFDSTANTTFDESFRVFSVSTLAHYPFYHNTFDVFGRFGAGSLGWRTSKEVANSETDHPVLIFGGGASWRMSDMFSMILGYDYYSFKLEGTNTSIGSAYLSFEAQF
ncbi:MAG TPA: hypothetical protein ENK65_00465 [Helicobacteraceae bacterium]|nr:hypothetical protein [Helicobacteraceae bacterium]